jgi:hypothetical protein
LSAFSEFDEKSTGGKIFPNRIEDTSDDGRRGLVSLSVDGLLKTGED